MKGGSWARIALLLGFVSIAGCASPESNYVGSAACASCHEGAYGDWMQYDHRRAIEIPTNQSVEGDFSGATFTHFEDSYSFIRSDSAFVVVANGDSLEVAYTFGHFPLQQYLLPAHGGRLQALTVAWNTEKGEWYSLYPDEPTPPGDLLHWNSPNLNWNYMCADCHSTALKRGYDVATDSYDTTFEELSVGCEACHGPGASHVEWADSKKGSDPYQSAPKTEVVPGVGRASTVELTKELNMCASCHSRRVEIGPGLNANDSERVHPAAFLDRYSPSLLEDSLYFGDGQIRDEVYVYGSFLQSKMAQVGVTCSDCHNVHTGKIKLPGNALCASCHAPEVYDVESHSGHASVRGLEGGDLASPTACVTCHMPERTYMGIDERRDHRFAIPDPLLSARLSSPDVCSSCHPTRSATWADTQIEGWRTSSGKPRARRNAYGLAVVSLAEQLPSGGTTPSMDAVEKAFADSLTSSIQKGSLAARLAARPSPEAVRMVMMSLSSKDPFQQVGALRALSAWAGLLPAPDLTSLFQDPSQWVRLEAVSTSLTFGQTDWTERASSTALQAYVASQRVNSDRPEAHLNLARMFESLGNLKEAESEFQLAVSIDSTRSEMWLEVALFQGRRAGALKLTDPAGYKTFRQQAEFSFGKAAFKPGPIRSDALYMFGLFLADDKTRLPDAAAVLAESARLDSNHPRKAYNAGLAYQQLGNEAKAEGLLRSAWALGSEDAREALVILFMQNNRWSEAKALNQEILDADPANTEANERGAFIQSNL
jgi:tetratricopeptide (TPR) repeat protein/Zn finger protein HypA/HybF involved in hydrogenase expression